MGAPGSSAGASEMQPPAFLAQMMAATADVGAGASAAPMG